MPESFGEGETDFLAGVEDIVRVKYFFNLHKEGIHIGAKHFLHIGGADEPVVMFARDRATARTYKIMIWKFPSPTWPAIV